MAPVLTTTWEGILPVARAAHDDASDLQSWLTGLCSTLEPLVAEALGTICWFAPEPRHPASVRSARTTTLSWPNSDSSAWLEPWLRLLGAKSSVGTLTQLRTRSADRTLWAPFDGCAQGNARDALILLAHCDGCRLLFLVPRSTPILLAGSERSLLLRLVHHIEAGLRLRLRVAQKRLLLTPSGELLFVDGGPPSSRGQLRAQPVEVLDGAHERPNATKTWGALSGGALALVTPPGPSAARSYVFCETERHPVCTLSRAEAAVVAQAARGLSNKQIALELAVSESFVSRALGRATFRLGCASRHELVRIAALLLYPPAGEGSSRGLTLAEVEVLRLVRNGLSNAEIAAARATSPRTVANQIARVLRKLGAASRRQVALG